MKAAVGAIALALLAACSASAPGSPPVALSARAALDGTPGTGMAPDTERFDGSKSKGPAGFTCSWDFGDGASAQTCRAVHTYATAGDFQAQLTIRAAGRSSRAALGIHVTPPHGVVAVARFDGTTGRGVAPDLEAFDGSSSRSRTEGAHLARCHWDFGDGANADGCRLEHRFEHPGQFTVTLTAIDSTGDSAQTQLPVQVDAPPAPTTQVVAALELDGTPGHGPAPDLERFDASASHAAAGTQIASCEWDFGDGGKATGCKTSHLFEVPGKFTVKLAVRDTDGGLAEASLPVDVEGDGTPRWLTPLPSPTYAVAPTPQGQIVTGFAQGDQTVLERFGPDGKELGGARVDALAISSLASSETAVFGVGTFIVDGHPPAPGFAMLNLAGGASKPLLSACDGCGIGPAAVNAQGDWAAITYVPGRYQVRYQGGDGAAWILQGGDSLPITLDAVTVDSGGEVVVAGSSDSAFDYDGQHFDVGPFLARIDRAGRLEWAETLVGATGYFTGLGTSARGTIVAAGTFFGTLDFAGQTLQPGQAGTGALLVAEPYGAPRFLRELPLAKDLWRVAVDPLGQVALVSTTASACGAEQLTAIKYNLAGDLLWTRTLGPTDCQSALRAHAVAIVGHEVLVAGEAQGQVGIGPPAGNGEGYVLDLGR